MKKLWHSFCRKHKTTYSVWVNPVITGLCTTGVALTPSPGLKVGLGLVGIAANVINGLANRPAQFDKDLITMFLFALKEILKISDSYDCRLLFWVRDGEKEVKALTDYVPSGDVPSLDRIHQAQGVVGEALRRGKPAIWISLPGTTDQQYRKDIQENYNFSAAESRRVDATRRVCFGIPILGPQNYVEGVLYIDFPKIAHLRVFGRDRKTAERMLREIGDLTYLFIKQMKEKSE